MEVSAPPGCSLDCHSSSCFVVTEATAQDSGTTVRRARRPPRPPPHGAAGPDRAGGRAQALARRR